MFAEKITLVFDKLIPKKKKKKKFKKNNADTTKSFYPGEKKLF